MSLSRSLQSRAFSPEAIFRFASAIGHTALKPTGNQTTRICQSCYEKRFQSRRSISTATGYQPYSLEPNPPPPRNTNIPETSITGFPQQGVTSRQSGKASQQGASVSSSLASKAQPAAAGSEGPIIAVPELEAQKSKPAQTPPSTAATTKTKPQRPSRLRSRKAAVSLTSNAAVQLRNLLSQPEPKMIRIGVRNRGCSGLAYHLEYVDKPGPFDERVEQDGVGVLIDSKALFSIIGSEMDWVEDKLSQRFVFRNPNIKEQCGCGESFMV